MREKIPHSAVAKGRDYGAHSVLNRNSKERGGRIIPLESGPKLMKHEPIGG